MEKEIRIAADVMGGDLGPEPLIQGCINFIKKTNSKLIIVGDEAIIKDVFSREKFNSDNVEIANTEDFISMDDKISRNLKKRKTSSIAIATRLVKNGYCEGLLTVGNTGAAVMWSRLNLSKLKDIKKPALCGVLPHANGLTFILDCGASVRTNIDALVQYAEMGEIFVSKVFGKEKPKIGLINIGKEESKGKIKIQWAHSHLKKTNLNYYGFVEGNDLAKGVVDIAVCNGFIGNVLLKYSEGISKLYSKSIKEKNKTISKIISGLSSNIKTLNGAPLLGVNGIVLIGHGSSDSVAYESGLFITERIIKLNIMEQLKERFDHKKTH